MFTHEWRTSGRYICTTERIPEFPQNPNNGQMFVFKYADVTKALGCFHAEKPYEVPMGGPDTQPIGGGDTSDKTPFVLEDDVYLGGEDFQIRAGAFGPGVNEQGEQGALLATYGKCETEDCAEAFQAMRRFASVSLAQSEFYYAGHEGSDEWMWNMNWRARLRRFALPGEGYDDDSGSSGSGLGDGMSTLLNEAGDISNVITH